MFFIEHFNIFIFVFCVFFFQRKIKTVFIPLYCKDRLHPKPNLVVVTICKDKLYCISLVPEKKILNNFFKKIEKPDFVV